MLPIAKAVGFPTFLVILGNPFFASGICPRLFFCKILEKEARVDSAKIAAQLMESLFWEEPL